MKEKTLEQLQIPLRQMLNFFLSYIEDSKLTKDEAIEKVLESYNDFDDFVYSRGDFKDE